MKFTIGGQNPCKCGKGDMVMSAWGQWIQWRCDKCGYYVYSDENGGEIDAPKGTEWGES